MDKDLVTDYHQAGLSGCLMSEVQWCLNKINQGRGLGPGEECDDMQCWIYQLGANQKGSYAFLKDYVVRTDLDGRWTGFIVFSANDGSEHVRIGITSPDNGTWEIEPANPNGSFFAKYDYR